MNSETETSCEAFRSDHWREQYKSELGGATDHNLGYIAILSGPVEVVPASDSSALAWTLLGFPLVESLVTSPIPVADEEERTHTEKRLSSKTYTHTHARNERTRLVIIIVTVLIITILIIVYHLISENLKVSSRNLKADDVINLLTG